MSMQAERESFREVNGRRWPVSCVLSSAHTSSAVACVLVAAAVAEAQGCETGIAMQGESKTPTMEKNLNFMVVIVIHVLL